MFKIFFIIGGASLSAYTFAQDINIIPQPKQIIRREEFFKIDEKLCISIKSETLKVLADYTADAFNEFADLKPEIKINAAKRNTVIELRLDSSVHTGREGYSLNVQPSKIIIKANAEAGLFYGIQTLLQLIPVDGNKKIPCVQVEDEPRFAWRGMLFDNCRHMYSVTFIKKFIDQLAYHKLNTFHWHLTDDQGWRIEIKKYPRLHEIASYRNGTQFINGEKGCDSIRYGGYYTQEQIKEIVHYAASRYIQVIPEIEMPGHSIAAITAYPFLACNTSQFENGKPFEVRKTWGVSKDIYCAGNDSVFTFLEDVLTEVMDLFPSKYIHIGGDEAPHDAWEQCPKCRKRMQHEGLANTGELQNWFIGRIENFINSKGRRMIGWEEIMNGNLGQTSVIQSWLGVETGLKAAKENHDVIMSPYSHLYFDGYQADEDIEPIAIGYWVPLDTVYSFEPVSPELSDTEAKHILGVQANLWTEFIGTENYFEYMVFPRIDALSEVAWSSKEKRNYGDFKVRMQAQYKRYTKEGICFRIPTPEPLATVNKENHSSAITFINTLGSGTIHYAINNKDVNASSAIYNSKPIIIKDTDVIYFATFNTDDRKSSVDYFPKAQKNENDN